MTLIDITQLGRRPTNRSCDHVLRKQPKYGTGIPNYDADLLLLQARSGERSGNTVSSILTPAEVTMMAWINITHFGRPLTNRSCDHVPRKPPNYDTDLLLLHAQSGEGYRHTVLSILTSAEMTRMTWLDITQLGRPATTRSCDHASQQQPNYGTEITHYGTDLLLLQA